jgi:hypothetical protein
MNLITFLTVAIVLILDSSSLRKTPEMILQWERNTLLVGKVTTNSTPFTRSHKSYALSDTASSSRQSPGI